MFRRNILALAAAGLAAPSVLRAQGAAWPDRPLRLIVPWPPGGGTDIVARVFTPKLSEVLGKQVVIENRGGASGSVGASEASRAAPDGYTWMLALDSEATNQTTMRLPYRVMQAFAPVSLVAMGPLVFATHYSSPWNSLQDVVAAAKQAPDAINYGTPGVGTLAHVSTTLLQQLGEFKLAHVPFRGGGPALQAVLSGEVQLASLPAVTANPQIRAGKLRPLGVTTAAESRHVPGAKSFAEQGFPGFEAPTWWAVLGRAGTPAPILERGVPPIKPDTRQGWTAGGR